MAEADRYVHLRQALGGELFAAVQESKVLVVGSGGIGVEIIKNLVLSGFSNMELIDLDTIDVSNLNRQFLFRSKHVGMSKSQVAKEVALQFNPDVAIEAHYGNVKDDQFGIGFFNKFDLVLNALDNISARQHVNRLCLAAKLPLIDAGTQGYLGQTSIHFGGETACFDCEQKVENNKTFPICTIRSTPDKPVHCIVWAKELFKLMFGNASESMLSGTEEDEDSASEANPPPPADSEVEANGQDTNAEADKADAEAKAAEAKAAQAKEKEIRSSIVEAVESRPAAKEAAEAPTEDALRAYARRVFDAVFDKEIQVKLAMRDGYKGAKKKPAPVSFETAMAASSSSAAEAASSAAEALPDQRVMSLRECTDMFVASVLELLGGERRGSLGDMVFEKDDAVTLRFVTAASNLRCQCFGIERKSLWATKGIAGNIIHAIATTNAIVAGLQTIEAIKLLSRLKAAPLRHAGLAPAAQADQAQEKTTKTNKKDGAKEGGAKEQAASMTADSRAVWVVREPIGSGYLLQASRVDGPNPKCYACGNATVTVALDTTKFTLANFVDRVLRGQVGVNTPIVMLGASEIYTEGADLEDDEVAFFRKNLPKTLVDCPAGGIKDGTIVDVEDFSQSLTFKIIVKHNDDVDEDEHPGLFILSGDQPVTKEDEGEEQGRDGDGDGDGGGDQDKAKAKADDDDDDDDVELVDASAAAGEAAAKKRPRDGDEAAAADAADSESETKRTKALEVGAGGDVITLD